MKFCLICLWKDVVMSQKSDLTEVIQSNLYKPGNWLSMADYFCVCMMLSSLAMSSMLCNRLRWWL